MKSKKFLTSLFTIFVGAILLATQIITDDFNRANSNGLGANWTIRPTSTEDGFDVDTNQVRIQSPGGGALGWYSGAGWTGGTAQYSEFAIKSLQSGKDFGPACRISGTTLATAQAYLYDVNDSDAAVALGSSISTGLYRQTTGLSFAQISTSTNVTISASDVIRVECNGSTIRGLVNGSVKISGTDSTFSSGNPGLYTGSGTTSTLDDWAAGDFGGGATPAGRGLLMSGCCSLLKFKR